MQYKRKCGELETTLTDRARDLDDARADVSASDLFNNLNLEKHSTYVMM